jgi:phosphoglycolate phosphatase
MPELKTLLFDLDGTLVRTREASWELFRKTNEKFGLGVDTPSAFFRLFNQNFYAALDERSVEAAAVKRHFQELLRQDYHPDLVPGMANVVHALAGQYTLIVVSSNTMEAVRRILLSCDVAHCFAHVFSGDVTPSKLDAISRFLADPSYSCGRRCSPHYEEGTPQRLHDPQEAMLITDTVGDVEEALSAGIRVGAVSWGMHRAEDLEAAGAEFVCIWPEELVAYLKPGETCSLGVCSLLAAALQETACECGATCCSDATASDPLLRQILTVLGSQDSGQRLSARPEESPRKAHPQLSPMAAPNGGRILPQ